MVSDSFRGRCRAARPIPSDAGSRLLGHCFNRRSTSTKPPFPASGGLRRTGMTLAAPQFLEPKECRVAAPDFTDRLPDISVPLPMPLALRLNGRSVELEVESWVTLLDLLRERLALTGTKKGCDHGQCGACTVLVDGQRVLSCLSLAVMQEGKKITTIEGLANGDELHPMQEAFIRHDGFQCGYCTPGQIMSAVACINEGHAGSETEIREYMSGNICRCGAYPNIVNAIQEVKEGGMAV